MIQLYQFPISHFCEKVRWALAFKKLDYKACNLLPGPHIKKVMSVAKKSEVPVLIHNESAIQGSVNIIDYLDKTFEDNQLTPIDAETKAQALAWEKFVDKEVGVNLRSFFYHTLLEHPSILIPIFAQNGPWYGRVLMKFMFPALRKKMISYMRLNDKTAAQAKLKLKQAIDKINQHLSENKFLAGDEFSRADLSAAALLAPLVQPEAYGVKWPSPLPANLQATADEWRDELVWVRKMYENYR